MRRMRASRRHHGFLVIAAVFLLVIVAALIGYLLTISTASQASSAADANSARAYQAARAGLEWASYRVLQGSGAGGTFEAQCAAGSATARNLTFGTALSGFTATVSCTGGSLTEGAATVVAYQVVSVGCNDTTCPNAATTSAAYVERKLTLVLTK